MKLKFVGGPKDGLVVHQQALMSNYFVFPGIAGRYRLVDRKEVDKVTTEAILEYEPD